MCVVGAVLLQLILFAGRFNAKVPVTKGPFYPGKFTHIHFVGRHVWLLQHDTGALFAKTLHEFPAR